MATAISTKTKAPQHSVSISILHVAHREGYGGDRRHHGQVGSSGRAAHSEHLVGALIVTMTMVALADVGRAARVVNMFLGAWVLAPWLLEGATAGAVWSGAIAGALVIILSIRRGRIGERYGEFERFVK